MINFRFIKQEDVWAKAFRRDDSEVFIMLDMLQGRKNQSIRKTIKTIIFWYLQEMICIMAEESERCCELEWCPMEFAAREMLYGPHNKIKIL